MSLDLDEDTLLELGWGEREYRHEAEGTTHFVEVRDMDKRREAEQRYQRTTKYRLAHQRAALKYYHANKDNPRVAVRGRNAPQSPETTRHTQSDTQTASEGA